MIYPGAGDGSLLEYHKAFVRQVVRT